MFSTHISFLLDQKEHIEYKNFSERLVPCCGQGGKGLISIYILIRKYLNVQPDHPDCLGCTERV